jgi:predicted helicase
MYRPFTKMYFYFDRHFNGMIYQWEYIYHSENIYISLVAIGATKPFHCISSNEIIDLHLTGDSQCLPLYRYDKSGNRLDNITDWGLQQFRTHYHLSEPGFSGLKDGQDSARKKNPEPEINKEDIFHYVYAVLHNPAYREKYELNLKREFPRIPFYDDFWKWANWGKSLMDLHINYETVEPFDLKEHHAETKQIPSAPLRERINPQPLPERSRRQIIKPKLKADKEKGIIEIDEITFLSSVPKEAWEYRLGNRSALEWILDQYKEKKPKDPTIAEKFNTYRFADYKEHVIDLLKRVCTVSVETMKIVEEMKKETQTADPKECKN